MRLPILPLLTFLPLGISSPTSEVLTPEVAAADNNTINIVLYTQPGGAGQAKIYVTEINKCYPIDPPFYKNTYSITMQQAFYNCTWYSKPACNKADNLFTMGGGGVFVRIPEDKKGVVTFECMPEFT